MSICLEETPFTSGKAYVQHMLICPHKAYESACNKAIISLVRNSGCMLFQNQIKREIKKLNERFIYMLTFTIDTSKKTISTTDDIKQIEDYIIKLLNSKSLSHIIKSHLTYEIGKSGNHHWHVYAECSRCLKKDRFKTYIKKYGNVDISRSKTNNTEHIMKYINKTQSSKPVKE